MLRGNQRGHQKGRRIPAITWLLLLLAGLLVAIAYLLSEQGLPSWPSGPAEPAVGSVRPESSLVVTAIDVGQGDSTLLGLPDGRSLLVDGGDYRAGGNVIATVRDTGFDRIDQMLATHPHADHIGGLIDVLDALDVGEVWLPDVDANTATSGEFGEAVERNGCDVVKAEADEVMATGTGFEARVIWPPPGFESDDLNDWSAILLVTLGDVRLLLTGDASSEVIIEACARAGVSHVDVLKVAHHGSSHGTTRDLARLLSPTYALVSCGADNPYGHPDEDVIRALRDVGAEVLVTAQRGNITLNIDSSGIQVN